MMLNELFLRKSIFLGDDEIIYRYGDIYSAGTSRRTVSIYVPLESSDNLVWLADEYRNLNQYEAGLKKEKSGYYDFYATLNKNYHYWIVPSISFIVQDEFAADDKHSYDLELTEDDCCVLQKILNEELKTKEKMDIDEIFKDAESEN